MPARQAERATASTDAANATIGIDESRLWSMADALRGSMDAAEYKHVVIEEMPRNFSAYAPDLPGCVATGATRDDVVREMRSAIAFHIDSLREHHERVPDPRCTEPLEQ